MKETTTQAHHDDKVKKSQAILSERRMRRARRIRMNVRGNATKPRLSVFRSIRYISAQLIDDESGKTLVSARGAVKQAQKVGEELAKNALAKKLTAVVFDRGSYAYHGHVKALAEGARKGGLTF